MLLRCFLVAALSLAIWAIETGATRADTFTVTATDLDGTVIDTKPDGKPEDVVGTDIYLQVFQLVRGGLRGDPGTISSGSQTYTLGDRITLTGEETFGAFVALRKRADGRNQVVFNRINITVPASGDPVIVLRFFRRPPGSQAPTPTDQPQTDIPVIVV